MWTALDIYRLGMWQTDFVLPYRYIRKTAKIQAVARAMIWKRRYAYEC